jgi:hypothetical protein
MLVSYWSPAENFPQALSATGQQTGRKAVSIRAVTGPWVFYFHRDSDWWLIPICDVQNFATPLLQMSPHLE